MDKFTTADSKTYKPTGERQSQSYGQGKIEGEVAQDTVCFTPEGLSCIEDTTFVAVDTAADLEKDRFSGIVGLSPFQPDSANVPTFLSQGEQVFSFYLPQASSGQKGKIVLGGFDLELYAKPGAKEDDVSWMQLADDSWTINMNGLKLGEKDIPIKSTQIMLDSGLSYNMVPQEDISLIEDALKDQGINCKE